MQTLSHGFAARLFWVFLASSYTKYILVSYVVSDSSNLLSMNEQLLLFKCSKKEARPWNGHGNI